MLRFLPEPRFLSAELVGEPEDGTQDELVGGCGPIADSTAGSSSATSLTSSRILIASFRASTESPLSSPSPNSSAVTGLHPDQGGESYLHIKCVHKIAAMKTQWETQSTTLVNRNQIISPELPKS